jgi:outer membrane murein-binding lipoprotein Lpp
MNSAMQKWTSQATVISVVLASLLAGCSTASKDIVAANVSPLQYSNYDCEQVRAELIRINGRVNQMAGKLDKNRENDNLAVGVSLVLFWPAVFFLGGTKEQEAEFAKLKGEAQALEQVAIQKRCGFEKAM